jgi:hypothetical protein
MVTAAILREAAEAAVAGCGVPFLTVSTKATRYRKALRERAGT